MNDLVANLKSNEPSVVCAAIESLEAVEPDVLKANIVSLLLNNNVWIRSRAARSMCRWDRTEAIRYLAAMLFSKNILEREAALNHSLFFPFKQIEAILLKFLTVEQEPDLINKAGLVFMANPDSATAFRLYEAQQATRNLRSDMINGILMGVLNSLYQARLVSEVPLVQLKKIVNEYKNRKLKLYINHYSELLNSEESEIRLKAAIKLCDLIRQKVANVEVLINDYLKSEKDESIASKVRLYLDSGSIKVNEEEIKDAKNAENRKKIYALINKDNYSKYISLLLPELKNVDFTEQLTIIHFIEEFGEKQDSSYVLKCLESSNSDVQQAAIDCLLKIDQDALQPYLPNLIKSSSDQVKLSAIKAFAIFDKSEALTLLTQMMTSFRVIQRKNALFCLANLDFASVSDILLPALKQEKDKGLRNEMFNLFLDNANEEIFCEIYYYYVTINSQEKYEFKVFLDKLSAKLASLNDGKKANNFWNMAEARLAEEYSNAAQREAYRLEKIQTLLKQDERKEKIELVKFTFFAHGIGFIFSLLIWFGFMAPNAWFIKEKKSDVTQNISEKVNSSFNKFDDTIPSDPISIKGVIVEVSIKHRQAMLIEKNGKKYLLIFNEEETIPQEGSEVSLQVLVEDYQDSVFTAEVLSIF